MLGLNPIRVLLVDDHPITREGLRACLASQPHIAVVGEAADGQEAIQQAETLDPDVILMDITMPRMNGIEATAHITQRNPRTAVLALTMHEHKEYILEAVRAGARGYVLKETSPAELARAIETVQGGQNYFSSTATRVLVEAYLQQAQQPAAPAPQVLTARERQVLALIADGRSNREAAQELGIGVRTVETHRERILRKLNLRSTAALTRYAIAQGLVK